MVDAKFRFQQCSHDYLAPLNSFLSIILYTDQIFCDDYVDFKRNILNLFKVAVPIWRLVPVPLFMINDIIITSLPTEVIYALVNFMILSDKLLSIFRLMATTKGIWISPMNSTIDDVIYVFLSI